MSKSISIQPYYRYEDRLWKVQAGPFMPIYSLHLRNIIKQIYFMNQTYSRTFSLFFDLHIPTNPNNNSSVTNFLRKLRTQLKSIYKIKKFGFAWCREQNISENPHFHFLLMINGSSICYPDKLMRLIKSLWKDVANGTARQSNNGYYMMYRENEEIIAELFIAPLTKVSYVRKLTDQLKPKPMELAD